MPYEENAFEADETYSPEGDGQDGGYAGYEDGLSDVEADADTLASAGYGTDEDYGDYGDDGRWDE